jgi:hypothetical protein
MKNKEANRQVKQQEVTITPAEEQREQVRHTTDQSATELKIETVEERVNPGGGSTQ